MARPGRIVGVDYGTKRVGMAIADPLGLFAQPYGTFTPDQAVERLVVLHGQEGLNVVVIGWPLDEAGREGIATERVSQFINRIRNRLPGIEIVKLDERYTSEEAKSRLAGRPVERGSIDRMAAGIILQEYLDGGC